MFRCVECENENMFTAQHRICQRSHPQSPRLKRQRLLYSPLHRHPTRWSFMSFLRFLALLESGAGLSQPSVPLYAQVVSCFSVMIRVSCHCWSQSPCWPLACPRLPLTAPKVMAKNTNMPKKTPILLLTILMPSIRTFRVLLSVVMSLDVWLGLVSCFSRVMRLVVVGVW